MKITALIMAGGRGERFWPRSRKALPKQFLSFTGDGKTMIQLTVQRISSIVSIEDVYIATNQNYKSLVQDQLPDLPEENILCEPVGRNTAPCIGLGAVHIRKKYQDAIMLVLPSDHLILSELHFVQILRSAIAVAERNAHLVTLGITPNYPETGYGYIQYDPTATCGQAFAVSRFVEKPNLDLAKEYLASGDYLWNSGMFIWKASSILSNMQKWMPDIYTGLLDIENSIGTDQEILITEKTFAAFRSESIDYGIMEKASQIYVLPGNFGWDDVGSWLAVERIRKSDRQGNVLSGNIVAVDTDNCIIESSGKLIAAVGLENLIIIDTPDATLVCDKQHAGDIKKILAELKEQNRTEYI